MDQQSNEKAEFEEQIGKDDAHEELRKDQPQTAVILFVIVNMEEGEDGVTNKEKNNGDRRTSAQERPEPAQKYLSKEELFDENSQVDSLGAVAEHGARLERGLDLFQIDESGNDENGDQGERQQYRRRVENQGDDLADGVDHVGHISAGDSRGQVTEKRQRPEAGQDGEDDHRQNEAQKRPLTQRTIELL